MGEMIRLCFVPNKIYKKFSHFKWVLSGLTSPMSYPYHYMEWDELGISYIGSNGVMYGPTYWTFDSYVLDGTPFAPDTRMPEVLFDGERNSETSKFDATDFVSLELYIHTTSGEGISPNGVGLISSNNQGNYQGATPLNFILYGLDEDTNEYVELVNINSSSVNRNTNALTEVQFEPQSETIGVAKYLLAPIDLAKGSGLRYEIQEVEYKRYMFRWDNVVSGSTFQLSRIQIDDVELPYTFVGYGISGGNYQSNEPANAMIASTSSFSDPNNKWCMTSISGQYAWFIFDLPQSHHPVSYRLMSGNDTSFQQGRNPLRVRLYGTNENATTFDDPSWVLLSDEYNYSNSLLATGNREWSNYIQLSV